MLTFDNGAGEAGEAGEAGDVFSHTRSTDGLECTLPYELAALRIYMQTGGAVGVIWIYPADFTDLRGYQSISQAISRYTEPQRTCGSAFGSAGLYVRTCWGCLQIYTSELSYGLCGSAWLYGLRDGMPNGGMLNGENDVLRAERRWALC